MALFSKQRSPITIKIVEVYGDTVLAEITTPAGVLEVLCDVSFDGGEMRVTDAHVDGLSPGDLNRDGLNNIAEAVRREYHVDTVVIEGASRSTGANPGRKPKQIRYPRRPRSQDE